jgi:PadR family transcriptional regulator PadR
MAGWTSQLRKGLVDLCILQAVAKYELYGYSLVQHLRQVPHLDFTESTVYPALARLIEEGLIRATERASPVGPTRRYLTLSAAGQRRLHEMLDYWQRVGQSIEQLTQSLEAGPTHEPRSGRR